jgi:hypothetical protein
MQRKCNCWLAGRTAATRTQGRAGTRPQPLLPTAATSPTWHANCMQQNVDLMLECATTGSVLIQTLQNVKSTIIPDGPDYVGALL